MPTASTTYITAPQNQQFGYHGHNPYQPTGGQYGPNGFNAPRGYVRQRGNAYNNHPSHPSYPYPHSAPNYLPSNESDITIKQEFPQ